MITTAPLPQWRDYLALFGGAAPDDRALSTPWRHSDEGAFWFSRAAWAFEALVRWYARVSGNSSPVLWVPDYFCNQTLWPVRRTSAAIRFYPIGEDLQPCWDRCREMAATEKPALFVLVHYFGQPAETGEAVTFCRETGAKLIEDAAHAAGPSAGIGAAGEFTIYSPYKIFAVPDGGLLLMKDEKNREVMKAVITEMGGGSPGAYTWALKRLAQSAFPSVVSWLVNRRVKVAFGDDPPEIPLPHTPSLSSAARRMLARIGATMNEVTHKRIDNGQYVKQALGNLPDCQPLFSGHGEGDTPYRFVLRFDESQAAAKFFSDKRAVQCPVESWPDLPPEVRAAPEHHQPALRLRDTLILLPVHQSLDEEALFWCCRPARAP